MRRGILPGRDRRERVHRRLAGPLRHHRLHRSRRRAPRGRTRTRTGQGACTPCAGGTYQDEEARRRARRARRAATALLARRRRCRARLAATRRATNLTAASECTAATPGPLRHHRLHRSRRRAAEGSFANGTRNDACELCPEGYYQDQPAAAACVRCAAGKFCPVGSSRELDAQCEAGTYARLTDRTATPSASTAPPARRAAAGRRRRPSALRAPLPTRPASPSASAARAGRTRASRTRRAAFRAWRAATASRARRRRCRARRAATRPRPTSPPRASARASPGHFATTGSTAADAVRQGQLRTRHAYGPRGVRALRRRVTYQHDDGRDGAAAPCEAGSHCEPMAPRRRCRARLAATRARPTSPTRASAPPPRRATSPPRAPPSRRRAARAASPTAPATTSCELCPEGYYQDQPATAACVRCAAGKFCPVRVRRASWTRSARRARTPRLTDRRAAIPDCLDCPAGSSCGGGAAPPSECSPGSFAATAGLSECASCAGGTYQAESNATSCLPCDDGQLLRAEGASSAAAVRRRVSYSDTPPTSPPPRECTARRAGPLRRHRAPRSRRRAPRGRTRTRTGRARARPAPAARTRTRKARRRASRARREATALLARRRRCRARLAATRAPPTSPTRAVHRRHAGPLRHHRLHRADGVSRGQLRRRRPQRGLRAVRPGLLPERARRRRLRPLRCRQVLPSGVVARAGRAVRGGHVRRADRPERRPRVPRLPRRRVVRRRGGAALRVLAGLFRRHGRPLRVRQLCGRDVPGRVERDGLPSVRGGQLLRRGRVGAAAVRGGQLLDRHQPHRRGRVHRRLAGPLRHHRLHAADGVRQGVVHGRVRAGRVHALRRRHVPGRGRRRRRASRARRAATALLARRRRCRARLAATRAPPTSPTRASAPPPRRATSPPPAPPSRRRAARAASPTAPATTRASCAPRGTTRTSPPPPPASAALLASFARWGRRASWTRSARRARTPG